MQIIVLLITNICDLHASFRMTLQMFDEPRVVNRIRPGIIPAETLFPELSGKRNPAEIHGNIQNPDKMRTG
ncbi:MAG: hypothetical protein FD166_2000 [Bacteroidetes bacterium]|nr:MAG: hypothetical protein FD166_2000 [Bacteroidota bacterium]